MVESDGHDISPEPDAFARRFDSFETDVWADAAELVGGFDALSDDALRQAFARAIAFGDLKRIALAGPALFRQDRLTRPEIFMLGRALTALGRREDAAEVFDHPWMRGYPNPKYAIARARALAAVGRWAEALEALAAAAATPAIDALRPALCDVLELAARDDGPDAWDEIARLARGYLALGLTERAAPLLARALATRPRALAMTPQDRLDLAELAMRADLAGEALACLQAMPEARQEKRPWRRMAGVARALTAAPGVPGRPGEEPAGKSQRFWRALESEASGDIEGAVARLSVMAEEFKLDLDIRIALARCVGKSVLAKTRPAFAPGRTGRIVNVMPFFNELGLLRLHLEEMAPWVDRFVIVEAGQTFTGMDKPLHFEANRDLFGDFADRIVHVPIRAFPAHLTSPWARDFYQRDMAIAGASGLCGEEDYILETDADEVIDRRALEGFEADFAALELKLSRFFLNYRPMAGNPERARPKASIFKAKYRARHGISSGRFFQSVRYPQAHLVRDAGWHFTSMFDAQDMSLKARSYAHQEHAKERFRTVDHFQSVLGRLRAGALAPGWERAELDDSFPPSLLRRRDDFRDMIL